MCVGFVLDELCSWSHQEERHKILKLKQAYIYRAKTKECENLFLLKFLYKIMTENAASSEATILTVTLILAVCERPSVVNNPSLIR